MSETVAQDNQEQQLDQFKEMSGHTLLLVQFVENEDSRTYMDSKTPYETLEMILRIYENYVI